MTREIRKILILSGVFFISGLLLFLRALGVFSPAATGDIMERERMPASAKDRIQAGNPPLPLKISSGQLPASNFLPPPEAFRHFTYDANGEHTITVNGICRAKYYTILIFPENIDYHLRYRDAVFNRAYPCTRNGEEFSQTINLGSFSIPPGRYYILRAHQQKEGGWYQPY